MSHRSVDPYAMRDVHVLVAAFLCHGRARDGLLGCGETGRYGNIEAAWDGAARMKKRISTGHG